MANDPLADAYQVFLSNHDGKSFSAAIREFGGFAPSSDVDYPVVHRICDHLVEGTWYRVTRIFDPDDGQVRLFAYRTETYSSQPGVPFWLQGNALRQWVEDESTSPTDEEQDWEEYRRLMPNQTQG